MLSIKEKVKKEVVGTFLTIPSPVVANIIGSHLDFIVIDMEHGPITFETAQEMIFASKAASFVRVSGVNQEQIQKALDIGAKGIHIPNIETAEQARKALSYILYPPNGIRGFSPFIKAHEYGLQQDLSNNIAIIIHLEGQEALSNMDEILKIPQIDVIFLGLYDLSKSLGIPGQVDSPKIISLVKEMSAKIKKAGKAAGTIVTKDEQIEKFSEFGLTYFTYSVDCEIIASKYKSIRQNFSREV